MATVVDFCCKGPGLLSAVPAKHNRIAVIDDNDLRTKIIISKKLPDVKIIERKDVNILKTMKDLNIIMNPPYDGSLHLKILNNVIKTFSEAKIVNLSPIRWLEDPLAEYKKNSDYKKFENIRKHIEDIEKLESFLTNKLFNISFLDLGIYTITKNGGWKNNLKKEFSINAQKLLAAAAEKSIKDVATEEGWRGEYKGIFGVVNSHLGDTTCFVSNDYKLFCTPRYTNTNMVLFFETEEERKKMFDFLTSSEMNAFAKEVRINQRVPWQFVPAKPVKL